MIEKMRQLPFVRLLIPVVAGIYFQNGLLLDKCDIFWEIYGIFISVFLILLSFLNSIRDNYSLRWLFGLSVFLFCFSGASVLTRISYWQTGWEFSPETSEYQAELRADPIPRKRTVKCECILQDSDKKVIVYLPLDSTAQTLTAGDRICFRTHFQIPENHPGMGSFDYAGYLRKKGFAAVAYVPGDNWERLDADNRVFDLKIRALSLRRSLLDELHRIVPDNKCYSVASAMMFGYTDALDQDLQASFSVAGVSHVLSVSGLHVGVLYAILNFILLLLGQTPVGKRMRLILIFLLVWVFALVTGLSPSVVRSAIMLSFIIFARILEKKPNTMNSIGASAFFMLVYDPFYLFDVGFQLSYVAVISIVTVHPLLSSLYKPANRIVKYIWDLTSVSLVAQFGTVPLSIYYFHQFPLLFLPANLFVIPLSGVILAYLIFSMMIHAVFPDATIVFQLLNFLILIFIKGIEWIESVPYASVSGLLLDLTGLVLIYIFYFGAISMIIFRQRAYFYLLILLVAFGLIYYL